ncbi:protein yippee-like 2 isoform X1 [Nelusetta ayraudi]|uniref:protein yippee-like 2 isoform X1 n=1 Tax=Nelusetta ayraudi TaxID=303726 RepID=UPI003F71CF00
MRVKTLRLSRRAARDADRQRDRHTDRQTDGQTDGGTDRHTEGQTDRGTDGQREECCVKGGRGGATFSRRRGDSCHFSSPQRCLASRPTAHHGTHLCVAVLPLRAHLGRQPLPAPPPTPPMVRMTRSKTFQAYLPSCHRTYSCIHCRAHLANHDELISKSFQGSQGRAYLFNSVVNVGCGPAEERVLLTGLHAVADIYCENCKTTLGWKYEHAFESSQKYKEGKFIIELAHMIKDNGWD